MVFLLGIGSPLYFSGFNAIGKFYMSPAKYYISEDIQFFEKTGLLSWHGDCCLPGGLIKLKESIHESRIHHT
jgi:hypothetical protein